MADRSSASIFSKIFKLLAKNPNYQNKKLARELYDDDCGQFDFNPYQMYCDDALITLGLAKRCPSCGSMTYNEHDRCDC